jgi:hypothetical protein
MGGGRERCCCAVPGCVIESDDFNRADNTNLGSKWTEVAGDSDIFTNTVRIPADGLIKCTTRHPIDTPTCVVWAKLVDVTGVYRVPVNIVDEDNYLYGQWTDDILSVWEVSGGVHEELDNWPSASGVSPGDYLTVCRNKTGIYAGVGLVSAYAWACVDDNEGRYVGLAAGDGGTIRFDDFVFEEHWATDPDCKRCACECQEYCVPKTLTLTFHVRAGDCELDGESMELELDKTFYPSFYWRGTKLLPSWDKDQAAVTYTFVLKCDEFQTDTWELCDESGALRGCAIGGNENFPNPDCLVAPSCYGRDADIVVCNPLSLTYGELSCSGSAPAPFPECYLSLIITE